MPEYVIGNGIARIAVPVFFLISGYLLHIETRDKYYVIKNVKKIFVLFFTIILIFSINSEDLKGFNK